LNKAFKNDLLHYHTWALVFIPVLVSGEDENCDWAAYDDRELTGSALTDYQETDSWRSCAELCDQTPACRSANYYAQGGFSSPQHFCQLNSDTRVNHPDQYKQIPQCHHMVNLCSSTGQLLIII